MSTVDRIIVLELLKNNGHYPELARRLLSQDTTMKKVKPTDLGLTLVQAKYFEAINWLLFGPLRTGRSHLIACVGLVHALNNPGKKVFIGKLGHSCDLFPFEADYIASIMLRIIKDHLPALKDKFQFRLHDNSVVIYDVAPSTKKEK